MSEAKPVTYEEVWAREFAPMLADKRRQEIERQTDCLFDASLTLCGEQVRQMWLSDMLHLDAIGNPFIAGSATGEVSLEHCAQFVWHLAAANDGTDSLRNLWRGTRFIRRLAARELSAVADEIVAFVDRMLLDKPEPKTEEQKAAAVFEKPARTHFLVPLLVNLSGDIGHVDPMSGRLLAHTPMPRLIQYARAAEAKRDGPRQYDEFDSLRNKCVDRMNQINAAMRAAAGASLVPRPS